MSLKQIKATYQDKIAIIVGHTLDPFENARIKPRITYYGIQYLPDMMIDGILEESSDLLFITDYVKQRQKVSTPVAMVMTSSITNSTVKVSVKVTNVSTTAVSGKLQVVLKEESINYNWQDLTTVDFVCRDFSPDENGEDISVSGGQSITKERQFTIDPSWKKEKLRVVSFVQKSNKEIIEGCVVDADGPSEIQSNTMHSCSAIRYQRLNRAYRLYISDPQNQKVTLSDLAGRVVASFQTTQGTYWYTIPKELSAGLYIISIGGPYAGSVHKLHVLK